MPFRNTVSSTLAEAQLTVCVFFTLFQLSTENLDGSLSAHSPLLGVSVRKNQKIYSKGELSWFLIWFGIPNAMIKFTP